MKTFLSLLLFTLLSVSLMAQTPVALKLNLEKGKTYTIKSVTKQTMQQGVAGQSMVVNVLANHVTSFKLLSQESDFMELEVRFDTVANKISSAMYKKETSSAQPGTNPQERLQNKMSLFPLKAKFSTAGKFLAFTNLNEYKTNVMLFIDSLADSKKDEAKTQATMMLKESALKSSIEPIFAHLTDKPVKVNDSWESSYIMTVSDIAFLVYNTYTLKAVENGQATLSATSEIESMPSSNASIKIDQPIKGSATYDIRVELANGMISTQTEKNKMEGTITAVSGGAEYKVDLKIEAQAETILKIN